MDARTSYNPKHSEPCGLHVVFSGFNRWEEFHWQLGHREWKSGSEWADRRIWGPQEYLQVGEHVAQEKNPNQDVWLEQ